MTKLFRDVVERVSAWPEHRQNEAAQLLLDLEAQQISKLRLRPEQVWEVQRIQQEVRDGTAQFATDEEMTAFWKKCGQ